MEWRWSMKRIALNCITEQNSNRKDCVWCYFELGGAGSRTRATCGGKQSFWRVFQLQCSLKLQLPPRQKAVQAEEGAYVPVWMMQTLWLALLTEMPAWYPHYKYLPHKKMLFSFKNKNEYLKWAIERKRVTNSQQPPWFKWRWKTRAFDQPNMIPPLL